MTAPSPAENLAWWEERAALHGHDDVYDINAVVAGTLTLYRADHDVVGDVTGLDTPSPGSGQAHGPLSAWTSHPSRSPRHPRSPLRLG